jgi:hypothetical protein
MSKSVVARRTLPDEAISRFVENYYAAEEGRLTHFPVTAQATQRKRETALEWPPANYNGCK